LSPAARGVLLLAALSTLSISGCGQTPREAPRPPIPLTSGQALPSGQQSAQLLPAEEDQSQVPTRRSEAAIYPGSGELLGPPPAAPVSDVAANDEGISFNFVNADIRDVAREILGEQMHVGYAIDPKVQATITAQTGGPIRRDAVIPAFESMLRSNGLALVQSRGLYRIAAMDDAAKAGLGAPSIQDRAGYGIRLFPLRYASADELKNVFESFMPAGATLKADTSRNLLIASGPMADLDGLAGLIGQFDVDWIAGMSFAIFPLKVGEAKDVGNELDSIFGDSGSGPLAGLVRIVPIERLNSILVISPQRQYLAQVKTWVDRLDYGDDQTTPRLFEYRVQNSRAADLAAVLTRLLSAGQVSTVRPEVAPGAQAAMLMTQEAAGTAATPPRGTGPSAAGVQPGVLQGTPAGALSQAYGGLPTGQLATGGVGNPLSPELATGFGAAGPTVPGLPPVRVVADEKNNALVIYAQPRHYKMIQDVIRRLDVVPTQVLLEATIAEVTLNDSLSYGLQFFLQRGANRFTLTNSRSGVGTSADVSGIFPGFNYVLSTQTTRAILSALSSITHVNVISSPQVLVLDHQTAALQVGDQVPIVVQSAQSVVTPGAPIVNSIEYRSTGVVLRVTPRVNSTGLVTLDIDQEVSDVTKTTTSTIDSPTITQRRIVSSVIVQAGETVALGGLIKDDQRNIRNGIPLLEDIPVVGALFRSTTNSTARTELLVLLSPRIIRDQRQARDMTEELRNRMGAVKPLENRVH
jgi:general secretion pathway protein D